MMTTAAAANPNVTYFVLHNQGMQVSTFASACAMVKSGCIAGAFHSEFKPLGIQDISEIVGDVMSVTPSGKLLS